MNAVDHAKRVSEAMALMSLSGKAATAFQKLLERGEPNAWFVVASKRAKERV